METAYSLRYTGRTSFVDTQVVSNGPPEALSLIVFKLDRGRNLRGSIPVEVGCGCVEKRSDFLTRCEKRDVLKQRKLGDVYAPAHTPERRFEGGGHVVRRASPDVLDRDEKLLIVALEVDNDVGDKQMATEPICQAS